MLIGVWGVVIEVLRGKDMLLGYWELAGVLVLWDWYYFLDMVSAFLLDLIAVICKVAGTDGILGNCYVFGMVIIARDGVVYLCNGWPICYTFVDSVL